MEPHFLKGRFTPETMDSYIKKSLKGYALDYEKKERRESETSLDELTENGFDGLTESELAALAVTDEYLAEQFVFSVLGEIVGISDETLADALSVLPDERRDIVLLSAVFGLKDGEIAEKLNLKRRTVAYRRTSSIERLKKLMGGES